MKALLVALCLFGAALAHAKPKVFAVGDVAVMQQNADGTYNVICKNGNREKVTDLDISLNNVCPNRTSSEPTNILSLQLRADGNFDVVCKDMSRVVSTPEDVIAGKACIPPVPPAPVIEDGDYEAISGYTYFCPQSLAANSVDGKLVSVDITWAGGCGGSRYTYACVDNVCSASISGYQFTVKILTGTTYEYTRSPNDVAVFKKIP